MATMGPPVLPLTTVFQPPSICFDNTYTSVAIADGWRKQWISWTSSCFPPGYQGFDPASFYYSPGICPQSYGIEALDVYAANATAAVCCPS